MASQDYKAITTIMVAMSIISYFLTLIQRSQPSFGYGVASSSDSPIDYVTGFVFGLLGGIYDALLGTLGSITGVPEWFNALFTIPVSIIVLMYIINKV